MAESHSFTADRSDDGRRLDQVLAARVPGLSRRQARVLIDIGGVFVDRRRVKVASRAVRAGQHIEAHVGGALQRATKDVGAAARARDAAELPAHRIVHEDDELLIVDKPAGLLAAPTPESDRSNLLDLLQRRGAGPVFLVHRIDLQTSGLLVFAKTPDSNRRLGKLFQVHDVRREYLAVVAGCADDEATVASPIRGKRAVTHWTAEEHVGDRATVLRVRLETGRTHQIRIHCSERGHPVLGDPQYGVRTDYDPPRMALHAAVLGIGELVVHSPLPDDLATWLAGLRAPSMEMETP